MYRQAGGRQGSWVGQWGEGEGNSCSYSSLSPFSATLLHPWPLPLSFPSIHHLWVQGRVKKKVCNTLKALNFGYQNCKALTKWFSAEFHGIFYYWCIFSDHPTRRSDASIVLVTRGREESARARSLADAVFPLPPQILRVTLTLRPDQHHHQIMMFRLCK